MTDESLIKTVKKPAVDVQVAQYDGTQECAQSLVQWVAGHDKYAEYTLRFGPRKEYLLGPYTAPFTSSALVIQTAAKDSEAVYLHEWIILDENNTFSVLTDEDYQSKYGATNV